MRRAQKARHGHAAVGVLTVPGASTPSVCGTSVCNRANSESVTVAAVRRHRLDVLLCPLLVVRGTTRACKRALSRVGHAGSVGLVGGCAYGVAALKEGREEHESRMFLG